MAFLRRTQKAFGLQKYFFILCSVVKLFSIFFQFGCAEETLNLKELFWDDIIIIADQKSMFWDQLC